MPATSGIPVLGAWNTQGSTFAGSTAINVLCPPYPGPVGVPYLYSALSAYSPLIDSVVDTKANWLSAPNFGVTHLTSLQVQTSATAHTLFVLRPLNFTYFPAGLAKNTTVIPDAAATGLLDDPGLYATTYKYPTPGGTAPGPAADAAISSTNKVVAYQLADGTWQVDTIASGTYGSTLTLTTGTPNRTGGAILAGAPLFYFGALAGTLVDPASGVAATQFNIKISSQTGISDPIAALVSGLHAGDPLVIVDSNGTAADSVFASGFWGAY